MPIIDPFDQVETEKKSERFDINRIYSNVFLLFKLVIVLISFAIILFLLALVVKPERDIAIQPFETTEKNPGGVFVADFLRFKLQEIKEINEKEIVVSRVVSEGQRPDTSPISLRANDLYYSISELGNIGMGGTSLSLGQLLLSLKDFFGTRERTLTGCIQRSGSDLHIVAILDGPSVPGGIAAWEIRVTHSQNKSFSDENISSMIEDLAFKIASNLNKSGKNPQTWEAFKNLTMSKEAYYRYNATRDIVDLNRASEFALLAKRSEPRYSGSYILFSALGEAYLHINNSMNMFRKAEQLFQNAIELNSTYANAWNGKGSALYDQKRYNDSIEAYNKAITLDPSPFVAWNNKGLALFYLGKYNDSLQAYDKAISLNQSYGNAWINKGITLYYQGRYNDSLQAFSRALMLKEDPVTWDREGVSLYAIGKYDKAIKAFNNAIQLKPDYAEAWNNKGDALKLLGKTSESNEAYSRAKELGANSGSHEHV